MIKPNSIQKRIYLLIFAALLFSIVIIIPVCTDLFKGGYVGEIKDFSEGWTTLDGQPVELDSLMIGHLGEDIIIENELPKTLTDMDDICFKTKNIDIRVYLNGRQIYLFEAKDNLTGKGYGTAYHEVGIGVDDAGKTVTIIFASVNEKATAGRLTDVCLCAASDFLRLNMKSVLIPALLSALILFIGVALVLVFTWMPNRELLPFNILALGAIAGIFGLWLLVDSNFLQLVTGSLYVWRDISRTIVFLVMYPIIVFLNSLTEQKRMIYEHISFAASIFSVLLIIFLRYYANWDMTDSFTKILAAYAAFTGLLMVIISLDNMNYCRTFGLKSELKAFFLGLGVLFSCGMADVVIYLVSPKTKESYGYFSRVGVLIFMFVMLFQFLKWWTKDHKEIERDRFINHALQFAVSSDSPENSIRALIDFLGTEFQARRFFIFEDQKNGKYRGTYEWFREGEKSVSLDIMYIPYEGVVDKLYDSFNKNDHRLIISNIEQYKTANPAFYNIINTNHVDNMVMGPLEVNGNLIGVCGVVGAPENTLDSIAEIISLISYFLAQLILQREEQKRLFFYSYNDGLSGARNHRAYRKFVDEGLDLASPFGFMRMNIEGLEEINRKNGYEAGDRIVLHAAKCLMEVFGDENVYRINGTEFVTIGFESEEVFFDNDVERVRRMIEERDIVVSVGFLYCLHGTTDLSLVTSRVLELLREDEERNRYRV